MASGSERVIGNEWPGISSPSGMGGLRVNGNQ